MFGQKKKKTTHFDTLIGKNSNIVGDINFKGGILISGNIKGNIRAEDDESASLTLTNTGTIEGEVKVPYINLNGTVIGDVYGKEYVELANKANVTGDMYYNLIEIAVGSEVNGKLIHPTEPEALPQESTTPKDQE